MTQIEPERRQTLLMDVIITLLAPLYLPVSGGNVQAACLAAVAMVNEYRTRNQCDLLTVAQIIAAGLASVHALTRSMDDGLSVRDMLALQRTGNALTRTHEALQRRLDKACDNERPAPPPRRDTAPEVVSAPSAPDFVAAPSAPDFVAAPSAPEVVSATAAPEVVSAPSVPDADPAGAPPAALNIPGVSEERLNEMWAIAMVGEASEISATLDDLSPKDRQAAAIRVGTLSSMANRLLTGVPAIPVTPGRPAPDAIPPPL